MAAERSTVSESESAFASFLSFLMGPVGAAIISFIALPVTTWLVGPEEMGRSAMFLIAYQMLLLFLCLGLDNSLLREFHASEDRYELFKCTVTVPVLASLVAAGGVLAFGEDVSIALFGEAGLLGVVAFAVAIIAGVMDRFSLLCIRMQGRGRLYSGLTIFRYALRLVLLVPLLTYFEDYRGIIVAESLAVLASAVATTFWSREFWRRGFGIKSSLMKVLLRYGLPMIPASIITSFFVSIDKIALRTWSTFEELGLYATAFRVVGVLLVLRAGFQAFWLPSAYRWHESGDFVARAPQIGRILAISLIAVAGSLILARGAVVQILSPEYQGAQAFIPLLVFVPIFDLLSEVTMVGINFVKRTSIHLYIAVAVAMTNFIGNYLLVPEYGAMGACIATAASYLLFFWARTAASMLVWRRLPVRSFVTVTVVVAAMAVAPSLLEASLANGVVAALLLISCVLYREEIRTIHRLSLNVTTRVLRR